MRKYILVIIVTILFMSLVQVVEENFAEIRHECYGEHCVDPIPEPMNDRGWGYHADWCEKMTWTESFRLNHNTTRTIFHQWCMI